MNRIVKFASLASRQILINHRYIPNTRTIPFISFSPKIHTTTIPLLSFSHFARPFCSSNSSGNGEGEGDEKASSSNGEEETSSDLSEDDKDLSSDEVEYKTLSSELVEDVETKDLIKELIPYFAGDEKRLKKVAEMVLKRTMSGEHYESDEELMNSLRNGPLSDVEDSEFESDFEDFYDTDTDIPNLYNATEYTEENLLNVDDPEMTAEQWDEMMEEYRKSEEKGDATEKDESQNYEQQTLEEYVEALANQLLPEDIRQEIEAKFNELCATCEQGEVEPEEAYALFKEFEEKMVEEYVQELPNEEIQHGIGSKNKGTPGEGPILRWETRVVLSPGGDAYHPKNKKVKVSVFVNELGLSKYAAKRLRALVGKRYNHGKDELTLVSQRFAYREENRKDVLRTLYALIEEAKKADVHVMEAYTAYTKERLKENPEFRERLRAQMAMSRGTQLPTAM